jgi:hypothetical protein
MSSGDSIVPKEHPEGTSLSDAFYSRAIGRIKRTILIFGLLLTPIVGLRYGLLPASGFLLGAVISYFNFHSLERAVAGLGGRIVDAHSKEKGGAIVARFLLRYLVIGLVVYVTFISWFGAFYGLLTGLCLPVAAMMGEAAWESYVALRRGL